MFIINCKNYDEVSDTRIISLVKSAKKVSKKYKIKIAIAPPLHLLGYVSDFSIPILAQHVDNANLGSTTGYVVPEMIKKSNVKGALINHSEHRISRNDIEQIILRLKKLKMTSVVCVRNVSEASEYAGFKPDYIAIEPPELIGSGKAISNEKPELITGAVAAIRAANTKTKLLCGAGIISGQDVKKAIELGSKGILVASGIVKAKNWDKIIEEFAKAMV